MCVEKERDAGVNYFSCTSIGNEIDINFCLVAKKKKKKKQCQWATVGLKEFCAVPQVGTSPHLTEKLRWFDVCSGRAAESGAVTCTAVVVDWASPQPYWSMDDRAVSTLTSA